jgi:hypothetical protein
LHPLNDSTETCQGNVASSNLGKWQIFANKMQLNLKFKKPKGLWVLEVHQDSVKKANFLE